MPREPVGVHWNRPALPGILLLVAGFVVPLLLLACYSVQHDGAYGQIKGPITLGNYATIVTDPLYLRVLGDTILLGLAVTIICAFLAYPLAYFLVHTPSRWRGTLMFLMVTPLMVSSVIRNIGWIPILGDHGAVNFILLSCGLISHPLTLMNNLAGVIIALVHALLPFMTLMLMTVIQSIRPELEEAARMLGATRWRSFWEVVFPLSLRGLAAGCALVFSIAVSSYTTPTILGGGRVLVMATFIAQQIQSVLRYAFGSALVIVLFMVALGLSTLASNWLEREDA
ncbi:MAG TPA: ABC transporter permease [Acetobacteraceae bacterium]|jgi:putative spermidine/putrescine transport system permease protein|nr:ABC transporter permease [Acetobacteraceae bacterium]